MKKGGKREKMHKKEKLCKMTIGALLRGNTCKTDITMSYLHQNKAGITLVALVITIIILLILSAIIVTLGVGQNGILQRAQYARKEYEGAQVNESKTLEDLYTLNFEKKDQNINMALEVKEWLKRLGNEAITVDDIVNKKILNKLMNSKNEVDYMVTNNQIMEAVLNSEDAIRELSKSDYAGYKIYTNNELWEKLKACEYFNVFHENRSIVPILTNNTSSELGTAEASYAVEFPAYSVFGENQVWIPAYENASPKGAYARFYFNEENYVVYAYSFDTTMNGYGYASSATINIIGKKAEEWKPLEEEIQVAYNSGVTRNYSEIIDSKEVVNGVGLQFTSDTVIRTGSYCGYVSNLRLYGFKIESNTGGNFNNEIKMESDLEQWLEGLGDNAITLEDIMDTHVLLKKLVDSKQSDDYMVTNSNITDTMFQSKNAVIILSKSDYAGYKIYTNNELWEKLKACEYFNVFHENRSIVPILTNNTSSELGTAEASYAVEFPAYSVFGENQVWIPAYENASPKGAYARFYFNEENYVVYAYSFDTTMNGYGYASSATINIIGKKAEEWKPLEEEIQVAYNSGVTRNYSEIIDSKEVVNGVGLQFTSDTVIRTGSYCGYVFNLRLYGFKVER